MNCVKKFSLAFLILVFLLVSISGCVRADGEYDFDTILLEKSGEDFNEIAKSIVFLETRILAVNPEGKYVRVTLSGMGLVTKNRYVLTAAHVVFGQLPEEKRTFKEIKREIYLITDGVVLGPIRIIAVFTEPKEDLALLVLPPNVILPSFSRFGNSDKLKKNNLIYFVGRDWLTGTKEIKKGKVNDPKNTLEIFFEIKSKKIQPGESGTPIFALMDGHFEIVGILQRATQYQFEFDIGEALKINNALSILKERKGINLR